MNPNQNRNEELHTVRKATKTIQYAEFIASIPVMILFIAVGVGLFVFFSRQKDMPIVAYILPVAFVIMPLYGIIYQTRLLRKKIVGPTKQDPFSGTGALKTVTAQPFERVQVAPDSVISAWFGPVDRTDFKVLNSSVGAKEYMNSAENTLLIAGNMLIGVALTQEDFNQLSPTGGTGSSILNAVSQLAAVDEDGSDQKQSLMMLNFKKWPQVVEQIKSQSLVAFMETHYNFAIGFEQITRIEPRNTLINPGVYIHINDGRILKYSTMQKELIAPFVDQARVSGLYVE